MDRIAAIAGVVLTLAIFSYLLADNFLYRLAVHALVGAAAGFALITAVESIVIPWLNQTILAQPMQPARLVLGAIPFLIGLLLLLRSTRGRLGMLGTFGLALVLGVGVGIAVWGAVTGTLIPLIEGTIRGWTPLNIVDGFIVLAGTVTVLLYFTYIGSRRPDGEARMWLPIRVSGRIGQAFIAVTMGAAYGLLILSSLTVLTSVIADRLLGLGR